MYSNVLNFFPKLQLCLCIFLTQPRSVMTESHWSNVAEVMPTVIVTSATSGDERNYSTAAAVEPPGTGAVYNSTVRAKSMT